MNTEQPFHIPDEDFGPILLQALLASQGEPVLVLDQSLMVWASNHALEHLSGFTAEELARKPAHTTLIVSDWAEDLEKRMDSLPLGEWRSDFDLPIVDKQGASLSFKFTVLPLVTGAQKVYVCIGHRKDDGLNPQYAAHLSSHLLWRAGADGRFIDCNQAVVQYCGLPEENLINDGWGKLVHPDDTEQAVANWRNSIPLGKSFEGRLRLRKWDGEYRWHHCCTYPGPQSPNDEQIWFGACFDVHEDHLASVNLREREDWLRTLFQAMHDGLTVRDRDGKIALVNHASQRIMGLTANQLSGIEPSDPRWSAVGPDGEPLAVSELPSVRAVTTGKAQFDYLMGIRHPDGRETWVNVNSVPVLEADGSVSWVVATYADVTEHVNQRNIIAAQKRRLEEANERLHALAIQDGLTGLLNHRALHERLNDAFLHARRYERRLSLILLDVDLFKRYNDAHGHLAGDDVLRGVAATLRDEARTGDIVGRYGGEEFLIILPETEYHQAILVAERLRQAVASAVYEFGPVTASLGVATLNELHDGPGQLLDKADRAMYAAKLAGRNRVMPPVAQASDSID